MYSLQIFYVHAVTKALVPGDVHKLPGVRETFKKSMTLGGKARLEVKDLARLGSNVACNLGDARIAVTNLRDDPNTADDCAKAIRRADNLGTCYDVVAQAYKVMCSPISSKLNPVRVVLNCS